MNFTLFQNDICRFSHGEVSRSMFSHKQTKLDVLKSHLVPIKGTICAVILSCLNTNRTVRAFEVKFYEQYLNQSRFLFKQPWIKIIKKLHSDHIDKLMQGYSTGGLQTTHTHVCFIMIMETLH